MRVANILPYVGLKIFAFQDRHGNKDANDLVDTLLHPEGGPGRPVLQPARARWETMSR